MAGDPYYNNTSLLLHGNGVDGATDFKDSSLSSRFMTRNGCTISTVKSKFGGASMLFNGSSTWLSTPVTTDVLFGSGDFTVEAWVNPTTISTNKVVGIWSDTSGSGFSWKLGINTSGIFFTWSTTGADSGTVSSTGAGISVSVWQHIVAQRLGNTLYLFINGIMVMSGSVAGITFFAAPGTKFLEVGRDGAGPAQYFDGYIDDVRITKGVARYAIGGFTVPSTEFDDFQYLNRDALFRNVGLLIHGNGPVDSQVVTDSSSTPKTITTFGAAKLGAFSKFGLTSLYFSGSVGDYLQAAQHSDFNFLSGDFTVEAWAYPTTVTGLHAIMVYANGNTVAGNYSWQFIQNGATWQFQIITSINHGVAAGVATINTWHHLAFVRSNGYLWTFVNGINVSKTAVAVSANDLINPVLHIGQSWGGQYPWSGYIDDIRITKGVARYTGNFTPPTIAFPDATAYVSGTITDTLGLPVSRTVRAYERSSGALVGSTVSSPSTGIYNLPTTTTAECTLICLDDSGGIIENDQVKRTYPV